MKADEFMAIAHFFTSEDVTRPSFNTPFRHGDHLFATDGRIAIAYDGTDIGEIQETSNETQKQIGDRIINDHFGVCKQKIASGEYRKYEIGKIKDAVCAVFANVEPEMMWLRSNALDDDDPEANGDLDSVRYVHEAFTSVIMANPARSVVAGYYASLIYGLDKIFGPAEAYSDVRNPHDMLFFLGSCWKCVLMPRLAKGFIHSHCAIADAITGKLVWGRECSAISPDMDTLRKGAAK